jgi:hypothetical protein
MIRNNQHSTSMNSASFSARDFSWLFLPVSSMLQKSPRLVPRFSTSLARHKAARERFVRRKLAYLDVECSDSRREPESTWTPLQTMLDGGAIRLRQTEASTDRQQPAPNSQWFGICKTLRSKCLSARGRLLVALLNVLWLWVQLWGVPRSYNGIRSISAAVANPSIS